MSLTGRVVNGVVVFPPGVALPEGAEVKVETVHATPGDDSFSAVIHELLQPGSNGKENLAFADLPDDLAANLDYYLHGHSRKQQPRLARWIDSNRDVELSADEANNDADQLLSMAAETTALPADLSTNHDHYLHGLPKR